MSKLAQEVERLCRELRESIAEKRAAPSRTRAQEKREKRKTEAQVIAEVRQQVFDLDAACICGRCKPSKRDQMHEVVSRAKTRGLPPEERFNVRNCVRMSSKCHAMVTGEIGHGQRLKLTFEDPKLGAMGAIIGRYKDGRTFRYVRKVTDGRHGNLAGNETQESVPSVQRGD